MAFKKIIVNRSVSANIFSFYASYVNNLRAFYESLRKGKEMIIGERLS